MLCHDSITYSARQNTALFKWSYGQERVLSYLPLSHVAGGMMDIFLIMSQGGTTCFADRNALKGTLIQNFKHYRPTRFVGVPRVFEKIEEGMKAQAATKGIKKKVQNHFYKYPINVQLGDWAKAQSLAHHKAEEQGVPHTSLGYRLASKLVLSKVHDALGMDAGQPNGFAIGGAAVSPETVRYFLSLDMKVGSRSRARTRRLLQLLEMISSTESAGMVQITNCVEPGTFRAGRVGRAYQDQMEVRLQDRWRGSLRVTWR